MVRRDERMADVAVDGRERSFGAWLQAVTRSESEDQKRRVERASPSTEAAEIRAVLAAVESATRSRSTDASRSGPDARPAPRLTEDDHHEMQVVIGGDVAFVLRLGEPAVDAFGRRTGSRARTTYGLSRIGNRWVVVHEHVWQPEERGTG
jgi:hypothetical protein